MKPTRLIILAAVLPLAAATIAPLSESASAAPGPVTGSLTLATAAGTGPVVGSNTYDVTFVVPHGSPAPTSPVIVSDGTATCDATLSNPSADGVTYTGSCTINNELQGLDVQASYNTNAADTNYNVSVSNVLTVLLSVTTTTTSTTEPGATTTTTPVTTTTHPVTTTSRPHPTTTTTIPPNKGPQTGGGGSATPTGSGLEVLGVLFVLSGLVALGLSVRRRLQH